MPELCEILITSQYLLKKIKNKLLTNIKVLSGRYTHQELKGIKLLENKDSKIINIETKGKFMWFHLKHQDKDIYIMNTFGLTGEWGFTKYPGSRVELTIKSKTKENKFYKLYYTDNRNFGTLQITDNIDILNKKLNDLAPDFLKTPFTNEEFYNKFINYKNKTKNIIKVLMDQTIRGGLGSGLGNYLAPEILYHSKISPYRKIKDFTKKEILTLAGNIKYITKLCYYNNKTGYMDLYENYVDQHRQDIKKGKLPDFHKDIKIKYNEEFIFNVYRQEKDTLGNKVKKSEIIKGRTTYWVPQIQI
jgi:formamidopyrimidine-DNA glycosylase